LPTLYCTPTTFDECAFEPCDPCVEDAMM
jgi:hypothetical protein